MVLIAGPKILVIVYNCGAARLLSSTSGPSNQTSRTEQEQKRLAELGTWEQGPDLVDEFLRGKAYTF